MESRLDEGEHPSPPPQLFDALDEDLDHIAFVLDGLRRGEFNVPLPWVRGDRRKRRTTPRCPRKPTCAGRSARDRAPGRRSAGAAAAGPAMPPAALPAAAARVEAVPEMETGARAQLRVRADIIDRLVNEAGEVAIARARVEGELRALKSNLLELTNSVIRLRSQMREIEIQAESQIQSQIAAAGAARRLRSAGIRPLYALPGADALARRRHQRRLDRAAVAAQEPGRRRRRAARAGAPVARSAAAAVLDPHRAVRQPVRAPLPDPARDRQGARQARQPRDPRQPGRARPLGAGKARRAARAPVAQRARPRARVARGAPRRRQVGDRRNRADGAPGRQRSRDRARRRRRRHRLRARARARAWRMGLFAADAAPTEAQLIECLFQPGFSTAAKVTQISGRGIGMDVVRSEIAALGGRVEVMATHGSRHPLRAHAAADARGRAGRAGARRRQAVGAARRRWSSRCSR